MSSVAEILLNFVLDITYCNTSGNFETDLQSPLPGLRPMVYCSGTVGGTAKAVQDLATEILNLLIHLR